MQQENAPQATPRRPRVLHVHTHPWEMQGKPCNLCGGRIVTNATKPSAKELKDKRDRRDKYVLAWIAAGGAVLAALIIGGATIVSKSMDDPIPAPVPDRPAQIEPAPPTAPSPIPPG